MRTRQLRCPPLLVAAVIVFPGCISAAERPSGPPPAALSDRRIPEGSLLLFSGDVNGSVLVRSDTDDQLSVSRFIGDEISPDGSSLIATREERLPTGISYNPQLVLIDTTTGDRLVIGRTMGREEFGGPIRWSPDGTTIAYVLVRYPVDPSKQHPGPREESLTVCTVAIAERSPRCFPRAGRVFDLDWSPDGRRLALTGPGPQPIRILSTETGRVHRFVALDDPKLDAALRVHRKPVQFMSPRWSPSGQYVSAWISAGGVVPVIFNRGGRPIAVGRASLGNASELM